LRALQSSDDFKLGQLINDFPEYSELLENMLPSASAYLLLNFSPDKRYLYVGNDYRLFEIKIILLFTKTAYLQISREREKTFFCRRRALKASDHHTLDDLLLRYNELKKTLIKTPIISDDDFLKIVSA
jgi:hypothetical protein